MKKETYYVGYGRGNKGVVSSEASWKGIEQGQEAYKSTVQTVANKKVTKGLTYSDTVVILIMEGEKRYDKKEKINVFVSANNGFVKFTKA